MCRQHLTGRKDPFYRQRLLWTCAGRKEGKIRSIGSEYYRHVQAGRIRTMDMCRYEGRIHSIIYRQSKVLWRYAGST